MLVLSRKQDEVICIGDSIRVMVVEIRGDKVRLGVEAPKHINIDRQEIAIAKGRATRRTQSSSNGQQDG